MYKVSKIAQKDLFIVECYYYNYSTKSNRLTWSANNIGQLEVARLVNDRFHHEEDVDMMFDILNTTTSPAYVNDSGHILPVSIKDGLKGVQYAKREVKKGIEVFPRT